MCSNTPRKRVAAERLFFLLGASIVLVLLSGSPAAAGPPDQSPSKPTAVRPNPPPPARSEASVFDLVVRLLFGPRAGDRKLLNVMNQGKSPQLRGVHAFTYDPRSSAVAPLATPEGARSILLHEKGVAIYLVGGEVHRSELPGTRTSSSAKHVALKKPVEITALLGFIENNPDDVLGITRDRALVEIALPSGDVTTLKPGLTESETTVLSRQSVSPAEQAIVFCDEKGDLVLFPKGLQSAGGQRVGGDGIKLDPRWSSDGSRIVFVRAIDP